MKFQARTVGSFLVLALPWLTAPLRAQTAAYSIIASFAPLTESGNPERALVEGSDGNFYGVTYGGAKVPQFPDGDGEVFKMTPAGVVTVLHKFSGPDGNGPLGSLVEGSDGNFYGTTSRGGAYGSGTVFSITPDGSTFTTLHNFSAETYSGDVAVNSDGAVPFAALVAGAGDVFYGTAGGGGANGDGTVFAITSAGAFTLLHTFAGTDGAGPGSTLASGPNGFYGTTQGGGLNHTGTVFRITASGDFSTLYNFTAVNSQGFNADGNRPNSLFLSANGLFYGTALEGGSSGMGTVFTLTSAGSLNTLHSFSGPDGDSPIGLVEYSKGIFYGITAYGGATSSGGTVFRINLGGSFLTIYSFVAGDSDSPAPSQPAAPLVVGRTGYLYGTTPQGSASSGNANGSVGTVYRITTGGALTVLHNIIRNNSNGAGPAGGLTLGKNGLLYGATTYGGSTANGTFFAISPGGSLNVVSNVYGSPQKLLQIADTNLYGTLPTGGTAGEGSVFKLQTNGVLATLYNFSAQGASDPNDCLIQGANSDLYGTTLEGGDPSNLSGHAPSGTIYQLTLSGAYTTLHQFDGTDGQSPDCLLFGKDSNIYGTTAAGGAGTGGYSLDGTGTVFQLTSTGTLNTLHSFSELYGDNTNSDGWIPLGIVQARDGNFYGVTKAGGAYDTGTFFEVTSADGEFTLLHTFNYSPLANVIQGTDGNFYVPTGQGDTDGGIVQLTPAGVATTLFFSPGLSAGEVPGPLVEGAIPGTFYGTASEGGENGTGLVFALTVSPAITSATTGSATEQQAYSYKVTATNTPTAFAASGLPAGLSINATTGLISGTPTVSGTFSVQLTATNAGGNGTAVLKLTVAE